MTNPAPATGSAHSHSRRPGVPSAGARPLDQELPVRAAARIEAASPAPVRPPVLTTRGAGLGFGAKTVVSGVSLEFHPGTINALIGPTGCGKTTLLRAFNRMNDKVGSFWREGAVEFEGSDVSAGAIDLLELRRRVGMVFQRPNPFPMSIRDNVVAGVRAHRMAPRRELPAVARRYLEQVGLWAAVADRLDDSPFRLSGGQQQLLCLARALAVEPDVLLLDEPTASLDPRTTGIVEDLLRTLTPRLTIVIVTHNLAQARRVAGTTAFLYDGRLVEMGDTRQLFDAPREPETVSYVTGRIG
jgi:phosphate transport system ATP-binding protein